MDSDSAGFDRMLRRACRRDPDALQELAIRYGARVFGLQFRLTGSREAAEDLTQDTFLRVLRMISEYRHDGKFEAWLFRIAANLARDYVRRLKRRGPVFGLAGGDRSEGDCDRFELPDHRYGEPDRDLAKTEANARLNQALDEMADMDREILLLRQFSELPFREIADLLDIPLGTALARAHRALKRLKSAMDDEN